MVETPHEVTGRADTSPTDRFVAPLAAFGAEDITRAGGKGANLGELLRAGYRVPGGFIVTTDAYTAAVERFGLSSRIRAHLREGASDDVDGSAGSAIRADFAEVAVPDDVGAAIVEAYAARGRGPVAVRSSATAEDLPGAAFAGQHDTYLNIVGEDEVLDAVRRCWASLWTDRAIAYRRRRGIGSEEVRMAVVVQAMVEPDIAGVMLTANPVTGARDEIVLDASSGLGEAVVSGLVTPDHYVLDSHGQVREWTPGQREVVIRGTAGGGVTHETTQRAEAPHLPDNAFAELARLGASVAEHFGRPQDIEWAYAQARVWLLQARPLTAVPPPLPRLNRVQRITGPPLLEMLPVRPYPLDMSAWILPGLGWMVARMLEEIPGLRVDFTEVLPEVDGVVDRFVPPVPRPTRRVLTAPIRNVRRIRRYDPAAWTDDPRFAAFQQRVRTLAERDPTTLPWAELSQVPRQAVDALETITDLRVDYLPRAGASLLRLRLTLKLLRLTELFPLLILGAPTRTADANRALAALGDRVRADDTLRALFFELDADSLAEQLRQAPEFGDFRIALEAFLDEYGHRETTSALLVSSPAWSEAPATVLGAIKALVEERPEPASDDRAEQAMRQVLDHPLVRRTRSQTSVLHTVEAARAGIALREDTHFFGTRVLPTLRRAVLEMGRRLADAGVLDDQENVFHLRLEELEELPDPTTVADADTEPIRHAVRARSAKREQLSGVPLISTAVLFPDSAGDADTIVAGTAAGGGRVTGPVRVIREPAEFGRLRGGDILVCPYTNPSWTSLFQRAAAVVVDTGGLSSHAAIVAREYGIPAVMGTGTATTSLTDGQIVTVDGNQGRVIAAEHDGASEDAGEEPGDMNTSPSMDHRRRPRRRLGAVLSRGRPGWLLRLLPERWRLPCTARWEGA
jgi:pyruvate,water dikinase